MVFWISSMLLWLAWLSNEQSLFHGVLAYFFAFEAKCLAI
jgi:hypothetical protein